MPESDFPEEHAKRVTFKELLISCASGETGPDALSSYLSALLHGRVVDEKKNLVVAAATDFAATADFVRSLARPGHVLKLETVNAQYDGRKVAVFLARRFLESLGYKSEYAGKELHGRFVAIDPEAIDAPQNYAQFFADCWYDGGFVHDQLAAMAFEKSDHWARSYKWYRALRKSCFLPDIDDDLEGSK